MRPADHARAGGRQPRFSGRSVCDRGAAGYRRLRPHPRRWLLRHGEHLDLQSGHPVRAEAIFAAAAIALLAWPHRVTWAIAVLVTASAAGAVLLYTYVNVGGLGPLPNMYEPTWALPGKEGSAAAEIAGTLLATTGLVLALRSYGRPGRQGRSSQPTAPTHPVPTT